MVSNTQDVGLKADCGTLSSHLDENNLLRVHDDASIELHPFEKVKVFNAMKSSLQDRQIGDRREGRNAVEARVQGDSVNLPSGVDLLDILFSPREECLWIYASDRKDFSTIKFGLQLGDQDPTRWVQLWILRI